MASQDRPACRDEDPEIFFGNDASSVAAAKRICASCPLRAECLELSQSAGTVSEYGTFGGLTEDERRALRGRGRRARSMAA